MLRDVRKGFQLISALLTSLPSEISGVITSYRRCLPQIQLYGPTNVAPIINRVAGPAQREQSTGQATVRNPGTPGVLGRGQDPGRAWGECQGRRADPPFPSACP